MKTILTSLKFTTNDINIQFYPLIIFFLSATLKNSTNITYHNNIKDVLNIIN